MVVELIAVGSPAVDGWFIRNVRDAKVYGNEHAGRVVEFEQHDDPFPHYGIGIHILEPGQPNGRYHAESAQEDFLVLSGECLVLIEGEERRLRQWDFVHCPPGTHHIFVGAGDGPCAILMVGARGPEHTIHYEPNELAAKYDASPPGETGVPREAYADWEPREWSEMRLDWPL
jgi:uncharacterized cupin superfamily protein